MGVSGANLVEHQTPGLLKFWANGVWHRWRWPGSYSFQTGYQMGGNRLGFVVFISGIKITNLRPVS